MSLNYFFISLLIALMLPFSSNAWYRTPDAPQPFILMLDPAGDAHDTGRSIDNCFERGITLSYVCALKQALEEQISNVRVILTRQAGQTVEPLHNANLANSLNVNLFLRFQFFYEPDAQRPSLYIYRFSDGDHFVHAPTKIVSWHRYDKAYQLSADTTAAWATRITQSFDTCPSFACKGIYALPCYPLVGIKVPALCIEMGLAHKDDWKQSLQSMVECINTLMLHAQKPS